MTADRHVHESECEIEHDHDVGNDSNSVVAFGLLCCEIDRVNVHVRLTTRNRYLEQVMVAVDNRLLTHHQTSQWAVLLVWQIVAKIFHLDED